MPTSFPPLASNSLRRQVLKEKSQPYPRGVLVVARLLYVRRITMAKKGSETIISVEIYARLPLLTFT